MPPYTYSILSGSLPAGLTLNPVDGRHHRHADAAGPSPFTAKVMDARAPRPARPRQQLRHHDRAGRVASDVGEDGGERQRRHQAGERLPAVGQRECGHQRRGKHIRGEPGADGNRDGRRRLRGRSAWGGDCTASGTITLEAGDNKTCTITNDDQPAHLTLVKLVTNNSGGTAVAANFTLSAAGPTPISGAGGVSQDVSAGSYTLSETDAAGYTASAWSCVGGTQTPGSAVALVLGSVGDLHDYHDDQRI